jgi:GntR family transcriptional regulator
LIPSELEFSDSYELSSNTLRRALNDLVQANLLDRKAGRGTFVKKKVKRGLSKVLGFTKNMTEMGLTPSTKVLSQKVVVANVFARRRLGLAKGTKVVLLERLRLADDAGKKIYSNRSVPTD